MKRYIKNSNMISKSINSDEDLSAIQNIAKQMMQSHGFDTSSWTFIQIFDGGYGKKGLRWNTPYGIANTVLDIGEYNHKGHVNCTFTLPVQEEFSHPFYMSDKDTTWSSIAEEFVK